MGRERSSNPYLATASGARVVAEGALKRMTTFRAPKGTYDVVPPQSADWLAVREALVAPMRGAGYGFVETPMFEDTALFVRWCR